MDQLPLDWKWQGIALLSAAYLTACQLLRYRFRDGIKSNYPYKTRESLKSMTAQHAYEIHRAVFVTEFPFMFEKALQFALFRTYGIPSISALLVKTRQLSFKPDSGKRYSDTEILIAEFIQNPPDSMRSISALSRINFIHGIYQKSGQISNDDMLYTLALFALEPGKWIARYEWRDLTDVELCAFGTFWKSVGDAMQISYAALPPSDDGLTWLANIRAWSEAYEARCMVPSATNLVVAAETTRLLLFDVPLAAHPAGKQVVSALMDVRLRRAMGFDDPPPWLCKMVDGVFWVRKMLLRYAILPRPWFLRKQKVSDEPDANGMLYQIYSPAEPWYIKDTLWNRWGPESWIKWMLGNPIPSAPFQPGGYVVPEVGPKIAQGKGKEEQDESIKRLSSLNRGGCPFGGSL